MRHIRGVMGLVTLLMAVSTLSSATMRARTGVAAAQEQLPRIHFENRQLRTLIDPRDGSVFQSLTAEGAAQAVRAVAETGRPQQLVEIVFSSLSDLEPGRRTSAVDQTVASQTSCFTLVSNGREFHFNLEGGGPVFAIDPASGERVAQFSQTDAKAIYETLTRAGASSESIMKSLFGLKAGTAATTASNSTDFGGEVDPIDDPGDIQPARDPLAPRCQECLDGHYCSTSRPPMWCYGPCIAGYSDPAARRLCWVLCGGTLDCCGSGNSDGCTKCNSDTCAPDVDPIDPA